LAAETNARILAGFFLPGSFSTPPETSTANGRTLRTASATDFGDLQTQFQIKAVLS
jgi:hypothetical protein